MKVSRPHRRAVSYTIAAILCLAGMSGAVAEEADDGTRPLPVKDPTAWSTGLRKALAQVYEELERTVLAATVEAEDFKVEKGWKPVMNGDGNYMVDIIGFQHISGERVLQALADDSTASACGETEIPMDGDYRLWVRYEYPPHTEARFRVTLVQNDKTFADKVMGGRDSPRLAFGDLKFKAQYDPSWGPEGLVEEVVDAGGLKAGKVGIRLQTVEQPQTPGVSANRNIDLVYLSADTEDKWRKHYRKKVRLYPILEAVRDAQNPRWEVRLRNTGDDLAEFTARHSYNRIPWTINVGALVENVSPGEMTAWVPIRMQDTTHFSMTLIESDGSFEAEIRPAGGGAATKFKSANDRLRVYLPPYPKYEETPITVEQAQRQVLKFLAAQRPPGKEPTLPLCYGGWIAVGELGEYGRNYAKIYKAVGIRSIGKSLGLDWQLALANLKAEGIPLSKSFPFGGYNNMPLAGKIERAKTLVEKKGMLPHFGWYSYGDGISIGQFVGGMVRAKINIEPKWRQWLKRNRPDCDLNDYWLDEWGDLDRSKLRPNSVFSNAKEKPKLFIDSVMFYEDAAITFAAEGNRAVKEELGDDILTGGNYSCHPFYYPSIAMTDKWFRGEAADIGRHNDFVWQVAQLGPMINGYVAEHFRSGMKNNPAAIHWQLVMPNAPGNTEASLLRSAFSALAHGAKGLDFFGIGMNECSTENYIDYRWAPKRYQAIREATHAIGLVEDLIRDSSVEPSQVALLLSDSTERWDLAPLTKDKAIYNLFGANFRQARLSYHLERLGIWKALTFMGHSPDLIIEEDLEDKVLSDYKALFIVGDHLPADRIPPVERWVRNGGVLIATAGACGFDEYGHSAPGMNALLGIAARKTEEKERFLRPRQELPYVRPLSTVSFAGNEMPQIAILERVKATAGTDTIASFKDDGSPAVLCRKTGKGSAYYVAALPGVAYLWSALQPPAVPDRGPGAHRVPVDFDRGAEAIIRMLIEKARLSLVVSADNALIDMRLVSSPKGMFLPIANYNREIGQTVTFSVKADRRISKVTSSYRGRLDARSRDGRLVFTIPELGYGDIVRLDY